MIRILFSLFFLVPFFSNSQEIDNLFYCNDNVDLNKIYILSESNFIAWNQSNNSLILYDSHKLISDTLKLGDPKYYFLQNAKIISDTLIYIDTLNEKFLLSISNNLFNKEQLYSKNYSEGFPFFHFEDMVFYQKSKKSKKDELDYDILITKNEKTHRIFDHVQIEKTQDKNYSGKLRANFYLDLDDKMVYLPVENSHSFITIKLSTMDISQYELPEIDKDESWYIFYDYKQKNLYVSKINKSGKSTLYTYDMESEEFSEVISVDFIPDAIIDSKIHKIQKHKNTTCHYLIPF